jgi:RNA recognition motif-containing protein
VCCSEFFSSYGEVKSAVLSVAKRCAFVNFEERAGAAAAMEAGEQQDMQGETIKLSWGK